MTQMNILRLFCEAEPEPAKADFAEILVETIIRHPGLNVPTLAQRTGRSLRTTQRYLGDLKNDLKVLPRKAVTTPIDWAWRRKLASLAV